MTVKFKAGAHSTVKFQKAFVSPLFASGVITEFPGADWYAVCYGELYAYTNNGKYLAIWSVGMPDCVEDAQKCSACGDDDYRGYWRIPDYQQ